MKIRRPAAVLMALLLVAGACSKAKEVKTGPRTGKYGDPNAVDASPTPKAATTGAAPAGGTASSSGSTGSTTKPTQKATTGGSTGTTSPPPKVISDVGGNACKPILQPSAYTEIVVEIDWVAGREPTVAAVNHLVKLIKRETGKPVTLKGGTAIPSQGGNYDFDKVLEVARQFRTTKSEAPVASLWVGYLDGSVKGGGDVAGIAWGGTIANVFMDTVDDFPSPLNEAIEKTILVQEIFHLTCMLNIGYTSPRDHTAKGKPGGDHHSKNPESVMYYALMTAEGFVPFLTNGGSPPTDFDADDRADLADIRAGRL